MSVPASLNGVYGLCELLRERIRSGYYAADGRLPHDFALVSELGVSRTRLRAAMDVLREEGVLTRRRGHGTFATERRLAYQPLPSSGFSTTLASQDVSASHEVLSASTWAMDPLRAEDFGASPGTPLHVIERLTSVDGEPMSFGAYVVRGDLAPDMLTSGLADANADMRDWLAASTVVPLSHLDVTVEAIPADPQLADCLRCPEGTPLLRLNRRFFTADAELLAFGSATNRGDRFSYRAPRQALDLRP
jgi:GntR family transcriptional regulator